MARIPMHSAAAIATASLLLLTGCGAQDEPQQPPPPQNQSATVGPSTEELARAVVHVMPVDDAGESCWSGSGTVVDEQGTILTNYHVIENDPECPYTQIIISVTEDSDTPPEATYLAQVRAVDPEVDLAVLAIDSDMDGAPVTDPLPFIPIGDSDAVELGDALTVLGYPGTGGETITLTEGVVSGFLESAAAPGERGWIKTQTAISGGNSGGAAISDDGRLIGVPTQVSAGDDVSVADCRVIEDTNGDGTIDGDDSCIPTGGFINGVRPVNLAAALIAEAGSAAVIPPEDLLPETEPVDASDADVDNIRFGTGIDDNDELTGEDVAFPSGTDQLCGSFDYIGFADGATNDIVWLLDGEPQDDMSYFGQKWEGGASGNWWVCGDNGGDPLDDGLWELYIYLDSEEPIGSDSVFIGDDYPVVSFDVSNGLEESICYLLASPSESKRWGQDELGSDEVLGSGETLTLFLSASTYDFLARDCDQNEIASSYAVAVEEGGGITLDGS